MRIILLADQERLIRLFTDPGAVPTAKVLVAPVIEDALAAISDEAPDFIFIQERLGEVSGEMLAHRLGNDLKGKRGRIVLIGDPARSPYAAAKSAPLVLDSSQTDAQLAEAVSRIVSASPPGSAKRRAVKRKQPVRGESAPPAEPAATPLPTETIADVVTIGANADSDTETAGTRKPGTNADSALTAGSSFAAHLEDAQEGMQAAEPRRVARAGIALLSLAGLALVLLLAAVLSGKPRGDKGFAERIGQDTGTQAPAPSVVPAPGLRSLPSTTTSQKKDRRTPGNPGRPSARDLEGEFVSYTIRPDDHIFEVLTTRFGLSPARAEQLIPRILRVNGIRDVRGLQVGRTIRIPLPGANPPIASPTPSAGAGRPVPEETQQVIPRPPESLPHEKRGTEPTPADATPH